MKRIILINVIDVTEFSKEINLPFGAALHERENIFDEDYILAPEKFAEQITAQLRKLNIRYVIEMAE